MRYNLTGSKRCHYNTEADMLKFNELIRSRKFWALIASVVAIAGAVQAGTMPISEAANMLVAALAAYSVATGIEDSGRM
jgi:hypothetical protein